jgi:hypothetical protein
MYKYFLDDLWLKRYDYVFYLPTKETYAFNPNILNDGTRFQTEEEINILEEHMSLVFTKIHKLDNIFKISSPLPNRVKEIISILNIT